MVQQRRINRILWRLAVGLMLFALFAPLPDVLSSGLMLVGAACLFFAIEIWRDPMRIAAWVRRSVGP